MAPLVDQARALAREAHATQVRKSGNLPYFVHLDNVAKTLAAHGHAEPTTLAAAYLHDLIEDQPAFVAQLHQQMPPEVIEIVRALSEPKHDERGAPLDKRTRFAHYLEGLSAPEARRALPISCADKIDNVRSLVAGERAGERLLLRFSTRPGEHKIQLTALRRLYAPVVSSELLALFDAACAELFDWIEAWLPARAVQIAADAHLGQFDKSNTPYIYHPLRLMLRANGREEKMVAVLHDVIEDSDWTFERLQREGFSRAVLRALEHLTRRADERYEEFIERVTRDRLAMRVKLLDLADNSDRSRLAAPTEHDLARYEKYRRATEVIERALARRNLVLELDVESRAKVRALARHPEVRGDHVTLAFDVDPNAIDPAWLPATLDQSLSFRAIGEVASERVQALVVEIAGSSARAHDGGVLHVTVSFVPEARASESNQLIASRHATPLDLPLSGVVRLRE